MSLLHICVLLLAGLGGGALNAVAGGGILATFPALVAMGVLPIAANATSTVALWPGSVASAGAYRRELVAHQRLLVLVFVLVSLLGGGMGAFLLIHTSARAFARLVPYLLLSATLLFAFGGPLAAWLRGRPERPRALSRLALPGLAVIQLTVAAYGGYFGGGGILMLAAFGLMNLGDIHALNALRLLLTVCVTGTAVLGLALAGAVLWPQTLIMTIGAIIGGYGGARIVRRIDPRAVRRCVILVGASVTLYFFMQT